MRQKSTHKVGHVTPAFDAMVDGEAEKPAPAEGEVLGHGAEARVYRATFCGRACVSPWNSGVVRCALRVR